MLKTYLKVMKALSDRNRVKIIKMLQGREMCVCEMRAALELAQPSVSKHLKILEEAGLVESRKEGLWVNYRVPEKADSIYAGHMQTALREWLNKDPEIEKIVQLAGGLDRCEISGSCRPALKRGETIPERDNTPEMALRRSRL
ncbi:MAG: metalloregulator ArsR/SmtB family transcription factor [Desulfobulbaceae bacterium]|nr:metalloregulator ArsR/SmtB family transcription factor [Desulfobulbaceae bacterium]